MEYIDPEADHWAEQMAALFRRHPKQPFNAVPYNAVHDVGWRIMDGDGRHVAIVFDAETAMLIAQRLNT